MKLPNPMFRFRCDVCGRFIALQDLEDGRAKRWIVSPDTQYTQEEFATRCEKHADVPDGGPYLFLNV
jgi:hypothetical protein